MPTITDLAQREEPQEGELFARLERTPGEKNNWGYRLRVTEGGQRFDQTAQAADIYVQALEVDNHYVLQSTSNIFGAEYATRIFGVSRGPAPADKRLKAQLKSDLDKLLTNKPLADRLSYKTARIIFE